MIAVDMRSMNAFRDDLALAGTVLRSEPPEFDDRFEDMQRFREFLADEAAHRAAMGDEGYEAMHQFYRWNAQNAVLSYASVTTASLAWLFDVPRLCIANPFPAQWDAMFREAPLRIELGELPMKSGESALFKQRVQTGSASQRNVVMGHNRK